MNKKLIYEILDILAVDSKGNKSKNRLQKLINCMKVDKEDLSERTRTKLKLFKTVLKHSQLSDLEEWFSKGDNKKKKNKRKQRRDGSEFSLIEMVINLNGDRNNSEFVKTKACEESVLVSDDSDDVEIVGCRHKWHVSKKYPGLVYCKFCKDVQEELIEVFDDGLKSEAIPSKHKRKSINNDALIVAEEQIAAKKREQGMKNVDTVIVDSDSMEAQPIIQTSKPRKNKKKSIEESSVHEVSDYSSLTDESIETSKTTPHKKRKLTELDDAQALPTKKQKKSIRRLEDSTDLPTTKHDSVLEAIESVVRKSRNFETVLFDLQTSVSENFRAKSKPKTTDDDSRTTLEIDATNQIDSVSETIEFVIKQAQIKKNAVEKARKDSETAIKRENPMDFEYSDGNDFDKADLSVFDEEYQKRLVPIKKKNNLSFSLKELMEEIKSEMGGEEIKSENKNVLRIRTDLMEPSQIEPENVSPNSKNNTNASDLWADVDSDDSPHGIVTRRKFPKTSADATKHADSHSTDIYYDKLRQPKNKKLKTIRKHNKTPFGMTTGLLKDTLALLKCEPVSKNRVKFRTNCRRPNGKIVHCSWDSMETCREYITKCVKEQKFELLTDLIRIVMKSDKKKIPNEVQELSLLATLAAADKRPELLEEFVSQFFVDAPVNRKLNPFDIWFKVD